ncbi:MAG TPA: hypothetical protein DD381_12035, partial [Lentisphaeria bacterium]|nr:hypothetical protein [Lentisphaeria bacterium]
YGSTNPYAYGRTFYAFTNRQGGTADLPETSNVKCGLIYPATGSSYRTFTLDYLTSLPAHGVTSSVTASGLGNDPNNPNSYSYTLPSGTSTNTNTTLLMSNWQGSGLSNSGYLDYQIGNVYYASGGGTGVPTVQNYDGLLVYLPEGLNTRQIGNRQDLRSSSQTVGYCFNPVPTIGISTPFTATSYNIIYTPADCYEMKGTFPLYTYIWDYRGYLANEILIYSNDNDANAWTDAIKNTGHNLIIILQNLNETPIIMSAAAENIEGTTYKSYNSGVTPTGLFIPASATNGNAWHFLTNNSGWMMGAQSPCQTQQITPLLGNYMILASQMAAPIESSVIFANTFWVNNVDTKGNLDVGFSTTTTPDLTLITPSPSTVNTPVYSFSSAHFDRSSKTFGNPKGRPFILQYYTIVACPQLTAQCWLQVFPFDYKAFTKVVTGGKNSWMQAVILSMNQASPAGFKYMDAWEVVTTGNYNTLPLLFNPGQLTLPNTTDGSGGLLETYYTRQQGYTPNDNSNDNSNNSQPATPPGQNNNNYNPNNDLPIIPNVPNNSQPATPPDPGQPGPAILP